MANKKDGDGVGELEVLLDQIKAMKQNLEQLVTKAESIKAEATAKPARGSQDVTEKAQQVTLEVRAENALRGRLWKPADLAKELGITEAKLQRVLARFKDRLFNAGSEEFPKWTLPVGDETSIEELAEAVRNLIGDRAFERPELLAATQANDNRLGGALRWLQRHGTPVENWGTDRQARWIIPPKRSGGDDDSGR